MESSDADDLVCPPPPVISKVSMGFGKPQAPKVSINSIEEKNTTIK